MNVQSSISTKAYINFIVFLREVLFLNIHLLSWIKFSEEDPRTSKTELSFSEKLFKNSESSKEINDSELTLMTPAYK